LSTPAQSAPAVPGSKSFHLTLLEVLGRRAELLVRPPSLLRKTPPFAVAA
jgi:hypothetical protein